MIKKTYISGSSGLIILLLLSTMVQSASFQSINSIQPSVISQNTEVFLGTASIYGTGNSSILIANAENDVLISTSQKTENLDFYIDYDMNCTGLTDEGAISLTIFLNDQNTSLNVVQTPTQKTGRLVVENISVSRGDSILFIINIAYGNLVPLYSNSTSATGAGIIAKPKNHPLCIRELLQEHIQAHWSLFRVLKTLAHYQ